LKEEEEKNQVQSQLPNTWETIITEAISLQEKYSLKKKMADIFKDYEAHP
jgi:exonuclease V gamma subunit